MNIILFLVVGFGVTNMLASLTIFEWFRKFVSGVSDEAYSRLSSCNRLQGCRASLLGRLVRSHASLGVVIGCILYVSLYLISQDSIINMKMTGRIAVDAIFFWFYSVIVESCRMATAKATRS